VGRVLAVNEQNMVATGFAALILLTSRLVQLICAAAAVVEVCVPTMRAMSSQGERMQTPA
jgi:hypothetical protein